MPFNTSGYLGWCLENLDDDDPKAEGWGQGKLSEQDRVFLEGLRALISGSVDSLWSPDMEPILEALRRDLRLSEWTLDDYFCRLVVQESWTFARRALQFDPVFVRISPNETARRYLREAMRAYVFGLFQAAVAMTRAALEEALTERVVLAKGLDLTLAELINAACTSKVLTPDQTQLALEAKRRADDVLHEKPCTGEQARDAITALRSVIEHIYR